MKSSISPKLCKLCESHDVFIVLTLSELNLYFCRTCGHYQLLDEIKESENDLNLPVLGPWDLIKHFRNLAARVTSDFNPELNGLIVDIGNNGEALLQYFQGLGLRVLGINSEKDTAIHAIYNGIPTLTEHFNLETAKNLKQEYGLATIITVNYLFNRINNIKEIILGIKELLAEDGILIIEVPYFKEILSKRLLGAINRSQIHQHTVWPFHLFLKKYDLTIFKLEAINTYEGSIRLYVKKTNYQRDDSGAVIEAPISSDVINFTKIESELGLFNPTSEKSIIGKLK